MPLTFRQWVNEGYKYKRFKEEFIWCFEALVSNLSEVVSESEVDSLKKYLNVIDRPFTDTSIDEDDMLDKLRKLRKDLGEFRKNESKCDEVYSEAKIKFKSAPSPSICVSRTKTALDLLSRYLRGLDNKLATQAVYIRNVYTIEFHKQGNNSKIRFSDKDIRSIFKLVSPESEARGSIVRALKNKKFMQEMGIQEVKRGKGELSIILTKS